MKIQKLDMNMDEATVTLSGEISEREYKALAIADYETADVTLALSEDMERLADKAAVEIAFSDDELFLLEMAVKEMIGVLNLGSRICCDYSFLIEKIRKIRTREDIKCDT